MCCVTASSNGWVDLMLVDPTLGGGGRDAGRGVNQCLALKFRREKNKGIANISPVAVFNTTLPRTP